MTMLVDIDRLKPTQLYLSQKKLDNVMNWFNPSRDFEPLPVRDFLSNGDLHLTDGHTRAFVAWQHGINQIPCVYDNDEIITSVLGQIQYIICINWCGKLGLTHISKLENRILPEKEYDELWVKRCDKMRDSVNALLKY